jgi:ribose/xylose/arabinose/galactoside ABC-type transport system permease subunit
MSNIKLGLERDKRGIKADRWNIWISRFGVYSMVIVFIILGTLISDKFLSATNFMNIIQAVALLGIVCAGAAFVTYAGHFADMSIPVIMAFSGVIAVEFIRYGVLVSIISGIVAGLLIGLINAYVIGKLKANPIIWTLAMAFVMNGFIRWLYSGKQIYPDVKSGESIAGTMFINLARTDVLGGIPLMVVVMAVMMAIGQFLISKTKFGQQLKLVGSSMEVAKMTGVNVSRTVGTAFMLSALSSSIGGIFLASLAKVGAYYNGEGYDFNAVTAIVIGGMTLAGGRGNIIGVLGGVFTIGLISNIMTLLGVDTFSQKIIKGIIFILVVGINAKSLRKLGRDDA